MTGHKPNSTEEATPMANPMDFVAPSQIVDLPSLGRYPEGHPLCGKDSIEIKYMTAKDEDILTNRSMLKKGIAIDRLIQNLIKDPSIDSKSLYVGDRNSIIIHARASAYGEDYKTSVQCPSCGETSKYKFDLSNYEVYHGDNIEEAEIEQTTAATFLATLPLSKIKTEIKPLTGRDEMAMVSSGNIKNATDNLITKQIKSFVISYNGYTDRKTINYQ